METSKRKYIDIKEFVSEGFLQEANRQFFHPLGLALEVMVDDDGNYFISGVWDHRDDPEGIIFSTDIDTNKAYNVSFEHSKHVREREELMGWAVQPLDWSPDEQS